MRTITDYISSYDTETGTTVHEATINLFTYDELTEPAKDHAVKVYTEERQNEPYFYQEFSATIESDIWDAVLRLENSIDGARVKWRYNPWYSCDFDCVFSYDDCYTPCEMEPINDDYWWMSADLCAAWNAHIKRLNYLNTQIDDIDALMSGKYSHMGHGEKHMERNIRVSRLLDKRLNDTYSAWYEELEAACNDVRNVIEVLLRDEWEYYVSEEYARAELEDESTQGYECYTRDNTGRVYYHDTRKWYTADGVFHSQSDINNQCISIVKAS